MRWLFALYVATYTFGRFWVELLRIDEAHHILGLRLNDWTSIAVFVVAVAIVWARRPVDDDSVELGGADGEHPAEDEASR